MAKRTSDDEDRVVPGGELPGDDDEEINEDEDTRQFPAVTPEIAGRPTQILQRPQPAGAGPLGSAPYTLAERLVWAVKNQYQAYADGDSKDGVLNQDFMITRLSDENLVKLTEAFGPDIFEIKDLDFGRIEKGEDTSPDYLLSGVLAMRPVQYDSFHEATKRYLKQNLSHDDIKQCFGIQRGAQVNIQDPALHKNFPDLKEFANLCTQSRFFLPTDPYMLLLAVEPEHRRFLSLCFDNASARSSHLMQGLPKRTNDDESKKRYRFDFGYLRSLTNDPLIIFEDAFKVRAQYGVKDPRPYFDALDALSAKIKGKSPLI